MNNCCYKCSRIFNYPLEMDLGTGDDRNWPSDKKSLYNPPSWICEDCLQQNNDGSLESQYKLLTLKLKSQYKIIGIGTRRIVFDYDENHVLKMPLNEDGHFDNNREYFLYKNDDKGIYAHCDILNIDNFDLLLMEKVEDISWKVSLAKNTGQYPQWCYTIDSYQVGITKDGRLVSYDFSDFHDK